MVSLCREEDLESGVVMCIRFSPDGQLLAAGFSNGLINVSIIFITIVITTIGGITSTLVSSLSLLLLLLLGGITSGSWCWRTEFTSRIPLRLTSHSFARRQHWLNEMYDVVGAFRGCREVKFDSSNNL